MDAVADFLPWVSRWFRETFGEPTEPQRRGWPAIASGRDALLVAPTGSGKTLAAFLWTLDYLYRLGLDGRLEDHVYVLYVSPLRALNHDIERNVQGPLAGLRAAAVAHGHRPVDVRVAVRTGDTLGPQRQAMTRRPPHVLITTPESLYLLLTAARFRPALSATRFVIVDEVHALLGTKRGAHLALSLERLQALVETAGGPRPQRIGCSATVSPVEEALAFLTGTTARDPLVVDAGFSRPLDLEVVAAVDDFLTTPAPTLWEATLQEIVELVRAHATTLIFCQSRRAAERLARDLAERIPDGRVAAHHGSLSRRARLEAEGRLKRGELRALVATSSLELGIDVGAIDLVIQLQSPRGVSTLLQRVGRAGHRLDRVSRGRVVVTRGEELLEAAAAVRALREHQLDRLSMPEAPLDVLAQQVVAAVAAEPTTVDALYAWVRRAAPYRNLSREDFLSVIRMLSEPLPAEVKGMRPRLLWDRLHGRLYPRRGARLLALTSGGTIPDAGLYDVVVAGSELKVGTLDEEFVTESLPGDVFLLGSHPWRILRVQVDRVLVEDAQGMSPTVPFWRGEHPARSYELGMAVARLRREAAERLDRPDFAVWVRETCGLGPRAAAALRAWLDKARQVLGGVPGEDEIVVESFGDELGGRHMMIHAPYGMRITGAWGLALRAALRRRFGLQVEATHVDDGLLLSFAPGQPPPAPEWLLRLVPPEELEGLLARALVGAPLFTTRFRHAAVRALWVSRLRHGRRVPAWLQRLQADALLEAVGGQAEFPVVAETLRECLRDALDVPRLARVLERLQEGTLAVRHVDTAVPSPFVAPLLQAWDWAYLDAGHAEERRSDAVVPRRAWLPAPGLLPEELVAAVVAELQHTEPARRARDANELAALLEDLGDLTDDEVADRVAADPGALLAELVREGRAAAVALSGGGRAWVIAHEAPLYAALGSRTALERLALRALRTRGPLEPGWFVTRYGLDVDRVRATLDSLVGRGVLRRGEFRVGARSPEYIHLAVLEELQRRHVRARRTSRSAAPPDRFTAFLLRRHHLSPDLRLRGPQGVRAALELLQGLDLPLPLWERALLPGRVEDYRREWLDQLGLTGEVIWTVFEPSSRPGGRVGVALREELRRLHQAPAVPALDPQSKNVWRHLQLRGASFVQDLARVTGLRISETLAALRELFWAGLAAPDSFSALLDAVGSVPTRAARGSKRRASCEIPFGFGLAPGRWSALVDEDVPAEEERIEACARLLLARYGVLARELAEPGWGAVRRALVRLEYAGEVVRGYFVEGLSGEQYALAEALEGLGTAPRRAEPHVLVNLADPTNLWGRVFALSRRDGTGLAPPRVPSSWLICRGGRPVLLVERHGRELTPLAGWEPGDLPGAVRALITLVERPWPLRPVRRLEVLTWDGRPVRTTEAVEALLAAGFGADGPRVFYDGYPAPGSPS